MTANNQPDNVGNPENSEDPRLIELGSGQRGYIIHEARQSNYFDLDSGERETPKTTPLTNVEFLWIPEELMPQYEKLAKDLESLPQLLPHRRNLKGNIIGTMRTLQLGKKIEDDPDTYEQYDQEGWVTELTEAAKRTPISRKEAIDFVEKIKPYVLANLSYSMSDDETTFEFYAGRDPGLPANYDLEVYEGIMGLIDKSTGPEASSASDRVVASFNEGFVAYKGAFHQYVREQGGPVDFNAPLKLRIDGLKQPQTFLKALKLEETEEGKQNYYRYRTKVK